MNINLIQQSKTNKQSFGVLLNKGYISKELSFFLKDKPEDLCRLQKVLDEVKTAQLNNYYCDIDFFVSSKIPQRPKVPSINLGKYGIVTEQLNIKQPKYQGMNPIDAIIQMLKDASELATKVKEA